MDVNHSLLMDTHLTHYDARERYVSRYITVTPTGRIKYKTTSTSCHLYLEVSYRKWTRTKVNPWFKADEFGDVEVKRWVHENDLTIKEVPTETIYECTTTSTPHGDSCCENHW